MTINFDRTLAVSMMMAAFTGIAWYIGVEINISLFLVFKRRGRGLYFWSCALGSWGVALQPLFIILANFRVWEEDQMVPGIVLIYLTWIMMVVPQSWVLYSRLHLIMANGRTLSVIRWILIFNSIMLTIPTMVIGTIAVSVRLQDTTPTTSFSPNTAKQTTTTKTKLPAVNLAWGRAEVAVFFIQETALSILYIIKIKEYLRERSQLSELMASTAIRNPDDVDQDPSVLRQLVYANLFIIALDIALMVIYGLGMFHLQGALKPCVYGIKLKVEFVILNRLRDGVRRMATGRVWLGSGPDSEMANWTGSGTTNGTDTGNGIQGNATMSRSRWHGSFYAP
ncbi:hypothetical protein BJY00DRAFT_312360 [Aspergillus carlsbadensis]|nr:hypothetical protein BJY00DRAFT_312360 [Aspergillus carlsbadensis]